MHQPKARNGNTREHARFPHVLSIAVTKNLADGLETLASDGLLTVSDHARQALKYYLAQAGVLAPPMTAPVNGNHQESTHG